MDTSQALQKSSRKAGRFPVYGKSLKGFSALKGLPKRSRILQSEDWEKGDGDRFRIFVLTYGWHTDLREADEAHYKLTEVQMSSLRCPPWAPPVQSKFLWTLRCTRGSRRFQENDRKAHHFQCRVTLLETSSYLRFPGRILQHFSISLVEQQPHSGFLFFGIPCSVQSC